MMEITIKINGRMTVVEVSAEVAGLTAVHFGHLHSNSAGTVFTLCSVRLYL